MDTNTTTIKDVILKTFEAYNGRRMGRPWVARMTDDGRYDFDSRVGEYRPRVRMDYKQYMTTKTTTYVTADGFRALHPAGEEGGDLIIYEPQVGQVYGYGHKDYRGGRNTLKAFARWDGERFVECDRLGK